MSEPRGWLAVSPRQAYELSRMLDVAGPGVMRRNGDRLAVLVDEAGVGVPSLAIELDADGDVVGRQVLTPAPDLEEEADLADLQESQGPAEDGAIEALRRGAVFSRKCRCKVPKLDTVTGACLACGREITPDTSSSASSK